jgi:predicted O-methyltransferase YrrM
MTNPIDEAHCDLIYGLAVSLKPSNILELGYGQGASARALWKAMGYNQIECRYTVIDDWRDYSGKPSHDLDDLPIKILSMTEEEFYRSHPEPNSYDLIVSDADHENSHRWFYQTFGMLRAPGLLIYHDVTNPNHPNLGGLIEKTKKAGLSYMVFNRSSRPGEECGRGLLIISMP